jgi:hypothetical protein
MIDHTRPITTDVSLKYAVKIVNVNLTRMLKKNLVSIVSSTAEVIFLEPVACVLKGTGHRRAAF